MSYSAYASTPKIGVGITRRTTDPEHKLGDVVQLLAADNPNFIGKLAMYVRAASTGIGASNYATVGLTTISCLATSVDGGAGTAYFRNTTVAFAANEYGWLVCLKTAIPQGSNS